MQGQTTFRCEGCGKRIVVDREPAGYSVLAMGCSLACTLQAVTERYHSFKAMLKTRHIPLQWQAQMVQAEMRPQQWLKMTERELHDEWARLADLVHQEWLARHHPDIAARLEAWAAGQRGMAHDCSPAAS